MRLRNVPGSREAIADSPLAINEPKKLKGKWNEEFGNNNPIRIEIGMGKGKFITQLAMENPDINYVGIEKYSSVLIRAIEKCEDIEIKNLRFIRMEAEYIQDVFEKDEVDRIYLNFSDPWPKDRHAKRRLTSKQFFERYDGILKKDGIVEFKTDNDLLFQFSLEQVPEAGWNLDKFTWDLHNDEEMVKGNVMTEYESKSFSFISSFASRTFSFFTIGMSIFLASSRSLTQSSSKPAITATHGTPRSIPGMPAIQPPSVMAKIIHKGRSPVELPRILGPIRLPSSC